MVVIDADNCIAGRLASSLAKRLLKGESIQVVNAEKSVMSGNPKANLEFFREKIGKGDPYHGPFYPKHADRILRRMVRGMLPYHKPKGRNAYRRLKVYISVPDELKGLKPEVLEKTVNRLDSKYTTLGKLTERLGG
jgi:large subunit ribosomal protein L13